MALFVHCIIWAEIPRLWMQCKSTQGFDVLRHLQALDCHTLAKQREKATCIQIQPVRWLPYGAHEANAAFGPGIQFPALLDNAPSPRTPLAHVMSTGGKQNTGRRQASSWLMIVNPFWGDKRRPSQLPAHGLRKCQLCQTESCSTKY